MFVQVNKHKPNMDFDNFLTLIAKVAEIKHPKMIQSEALSNLLHFHFLPLYDSIMKETDLGEDEIRFNEEIDISCIMMIKDIIPIISKIY